MGIVETASLAVHLLFGAVWVGAVAFLAFAVLPVAAAREGTVDATTLEAVVVRLTNLSRAGALLTLLTGGHLALAWYGVEGLFGSTRGHLVVGMTVLWLVFTGLVEVAGAKITDDLREKRVRGPARDYLTWYRGAAAVGGLLLLDAAAIYALRAGALGV